MNGYTIFHQLHHNNEPLLIGNAWDARSAAAYEQNSFKAIATSSAAIAHMLGYEDGEGMSFDELLFIVKRIASVTTLPLSVDIEGGYSRDHNVIIENIEKLHDLGVVGINIEDTAVVNGKREFLTAEDFKGTIGIIKNALAKKNIQIFLNARTDAFLAGLENPLSETINRIKAYESAGADGIFVPCVTAVDDIRSIVDTTKLPVNVLCMPTLPDFKTLKELGVKRISTGNALHDYQSAALDKIIKDIVANQSFSCLG